MKKAFTVMAIGLAFATGSFCMSLQSASAASTGSSLVESATDNITDVSIDQYLANISGIEEVTGQRLLNLIHSNGTYILFVGYKECPYCREFSKTLKEFKSESVVPLYYVNLDDNYTDITQNQLIEISDFLQKQVKVERTPTVVKITNKVAGPVFVGSETTLQQLNSLLN